MAIKHLNQYQIDFIASHKDNMKRVDIARRLRVSAECVGQRIRKMEAQELLEKESLLTNTVVSK